MHKAVNKEKTIIFSGGGTGGPVTPLVALATELKNDLPRARLVFVGGYGGPERELVNKSAVNFVFLAISGGKWRRYFSLNNFFDIFRIALGFLQSLLIIRRYRPDLIVTAGGFISVPLVYAGRLLGVPALVHQQDVRPGLANKLMARVARAVTVSFEKSILDFGPRAIWTGNPSVDPRPFLDSVETTRSKYHLRDDKPLVLVIGGATGAKALNEMVVGALPGLLAKAQIVHLTGRNKSAAPLSFADHYSFEFLPQAEVLKIMAAADIVVSRCGLGVLTEIISLRKPSILIPMPDSHQEDNAAVFAAADAAIILNQKESNADSLRLEIESLLADSRLREKLARNVARLMRPGAIDNILGIIKEII